MPPRANPMPASLPALVNTFSGGVAAAGWFVIVGVSVYCVPFRSRPGIGGCVDRDRMTRCAPARPDRMPNSFPCKRYAAAQNAATLRYNQI